METIHPLSSLGEGQDAVVSSLRLEGPIRSRLMDLGFTEGAPVRCIQKSPWGDPTAYLVRGAVIALRKEDSCRVLVHYQPGAASKRGDLPWA